MGRHPFRYLHRHRHHLATPLDRRQMRQQSLRCHHCRHHHQRCRQSIIITVLRLVRIERRPVNGVWNPSSSSSSSSSSMIPSRSVSYPKTGGRPVFCITTVEFGLSSVGIDRMPFHFAQRMRTYTRPLCQSCRSLLRKCRHRHSPVTQFPHTAG